VAEAPKLLDRVRGVVRARHYSRRTEEAYVQWIRRYILFHQKRHPSELGASHVTAFLTSLATETSVAAATQNQAFSAVMFLYRNVLHQELGDIEHAPRAKSPVRVPVVLSPDEVRRVLDRMSGTARLVGALLYGAGLGPRLRARGAAGRPRAQVPECADRVALAICVSGRPDLPRSAVRSAVPVPLARIGDSTRMYSTAAGSA
jgi:hypothetical protein